MTLRPSTICKSEQNLAPICCAEVCEGVPHGAELFQSLRLTGPGTSLDSPAIDGQRPASRDRLGGLTAMHTPDVRPGGPQLAYVQRTLTNPHTDARAQELRRVRLVASASCRARGHLARASGRRRSTERAP